MTGGTMDLGQKSLRNATIVRLYEVEGYTMEKVAVRFRISRERVRQILGRAGVESWTTESYCHAKRILWTCSVCGKQERVAPYYARVRKVCGKSCAGKLRIRWFKPELIACLQALADELGHTPSMNDINAVSPPNHMSYVQNFGSIRAAQEAAGLVPNRRGHRAEPLA